MSEPASDDRVVIDGPVPFRESAVWTRQRAFYEEQAESAWSEGIVPHYITSNPFVADTYAQLISAYAIDVSSVLDHDQPLTILELGAGSGRLSHHLITALLRQRDELGPAGTFPFRYVMSDFAESNIGFWRTHPVLAAHVDAGILDFATFDVDRSDELRLDHAGLVASTDAPTGPVVVIANYVFDSVPLDVFVVEEGVLGEALASWLVPPDLATSEDHAQLISNSAIRWSVRPATQPYYGVQRWDDVIDGCVAELADGPFSIPISTFACLDRLRAISGGDLLVLSSDKGYFSDEEVAFQAMPKLATHGAISAMVSYNAIARYVRSLGGHAFGPATANNDLCTTAFVLAPADADGARNPATSTARAFAATVGRYSPADFYRLYAWIQTQSEEITLESALSALALSRYDPQVLVVCLRSLFAALADLAPEGAALLRDAVAKTADTYFPIGEEIDVHDAAGSLLASLHDFEAARTCFESSIRWHGERPDVVAKRDACVARLADPPIDR